MSIAFVNSNAASTAATPVTSLTSAAVSLTAGNLFVFAAINLPAGGTISDTAGNNFVSCGPAQNGIQFWYAKNCLGNASNKIMASFTSASYVAIFAAQYSGVATGSPIDVVPANANGTGTGTAMATASFSTGRANEVIVAVCDGSDGANSAGSPNFTSRQASAGFSNMLEDWIPTSLQSGVVANASQGSSAAWNIAAVSFASINNTLNTPTFSPVAGTYTGSQTVTISSNGIGEAIYYTTDGSTPTSGSTLYSGPITVSASETVKAIAELTGWTNSAVGSAAYVVSSGGGIGTVKTSGAATPAVVCNASGAPLVITNPTTSGRLGNPTPVVFCDQYGNELAVTGATVGSHIANPIPVVLCTPAGFTITPTYTLTSNGNAIVVTATKTGNKFGKPTPVCISDPNGFGYLTTGFSATGSFLGNPLPICLTNTSGQPLTLTIGN